MYLELGTRAGAKRGNAGRTGNLVAILRMDTNQILNINMNRALGSFQESNASEFMRKVGWTGRWVPGLHQGALDAGEQEAGEAGAPVEGEEPRRPPEDRNGGGGKREGPWENIRTKDSFRTERILRAAMEEGVAVCFRPALR